MVLHWYHTNRQILPTMPLPQPEPDKPLYWIGVDGGGTGTRARLQDPGGRTLGEGKAGPSGLSQGLEQAWSHVELAVLAAFASAGLQRPALQRCALALAQP